MFEKVDRENLLKYVWVSLDTTKKNFLFSCDVYWKGTLMTEKADVLG